MEAVLIILAAILWIGYNRFIRLREEAKEMELNKRHDRDRQPTKKQMDSRNLWPSPAEVKPQILSGNEPIMFNFTGYFDDTKQYQCGDVVNFQYSYYVWTDSGWVWIN